MKLTRDSILRHVAHLAERAERRVEEVELRGEVALAVARGRVDLLVGVRRRLVGRGLELDAALEELEAAEVALGSAAAG